MTTLQDDPQRPATTKAKAKALTDKVTPVAALQKSQLVSQHKYNDVMTVALVADATATAAPTSAIQILLWRV